MRYHKILPLLVILILAGCGKTANEAGDTEIPHSSKSEMTTYDSEIPVSSESEVTTYDSEIPVSSEPEVITYDSEIPRTPKYESITYELWKTDIMSIDEETVYVSTTYTEPTIHLKDETAAQKIKSEFDVLRSDYDAELADICEEAKARADEPDSHFISFELDQYFSTIRNDARILSIESYHHIYRMTTHGYYTYSGLNFDLFTGEKLTLDSISTDKDALLSSAHDYIESLLQLPEYTVRLYDTTMEETMNTIDNYILTDDRWYFTNDGITFIANDYDIGPYIAGPFFLQIPFEKLEGLKPEYAYIAL